MMGNLQRSCRAQDVFVGCEASTNECEPLADVRRFRVVVEVKPKQVNVAEVIRLGETKSRPEGEAKHLLVHFRKLSLQLVGEHHPFRFCEASFLQPLLVAPME